MRELLGVHWTKGSCLRGTTCLRYSIKNNVVSEHYGSPATMRGDGHHTRYIFIETQFQGLSSGGGRQVVGPLKHLFGAFSS